MEHNTRRCIKRWKDSISGKLSIFAFLVTVPAYTLGNGNMPVGVAPSEWDITRWIVVTMFTVFGVIGLRSINKFDRNQELLFERMREADKEREEYRAKMSDRFGEIEKNLAVIDERCELNDCTKPREAKR